MAKPAARLVLLQVLLGVGALAVGVRAVMLQVVQHDFWDGRAAARDLRAREVAAPRGTIFDRRGVPLAVTQERYRLSLAQNELRDREETKRILVQRLGLTRAAVERAFERPYPYFHGPFSAEQVEPLRRQRGVHLEVLYGRAYPLRPSGRDPLLGYIDAAANRGLDGLELALDSLLQGRPGLVNMMRDPGGREIAIPRGVIRPAVPGRDVVLTIDHEWQAIAEGVLRRTVVANDAQGGDVVIFDIASGELLAIASLRLDERSGRVVPTASALIEPYDPGSTAKIFTVGAMLMSGSDTTPVSGEGGYWEMDIGGGRTRAFRDVSKQSGLLTPGLAIKYSSNIAMAKFAVRVPLEAHYRTLRDFGIGTAPGLGFPSESRGRLQHAREVYNARVTQPSWSQGYELTATAVQLAAAYGAIANRGTLLAPALVREVRDGATGAVQWRHEPLRLREAVTPAVAAQLMEYLRIATDSGGGGARARLDEIPIVGKTGTAVLVNDQGTYGGAGHRASFAGIFPGDDPQVVVYAMINRPRGGEIYGGVIAAPMVKAILQQGLTSPANELGRGRLTERVALPVARPRRADDAPARLLPLPLPAAAGDSAAMREVPDVAGFSSREAVHRLHQRGFLVRLAGAGVARTTDPAAGDSLPAGATVTLIAGPPP